jgi:hypothetical protein
VCLKSNCLWKTLVLMKIFHMKSARCNGVTTLRKKLLGKEKKNGRQSFHVSFLIRPNLEDEIHFKGGRFVTP